MTGDAINALASRFRGPMEVGGFLYRPDDWVVEDPSALIKSGPLATPLVVHTLGALKDYVHANRDGLALESMIVHVEHPTRVRLSGPLAAVTRVRETYVEARALDLMAAVTDRAFPFLGTFMALEPFIIGLQVRFLETAQRQQVLALLSTVKHESVKTALDNGLTQVVQARAGVALVNDVPVPNPVTLRPYRTFLDVLQPESEFMLRVKAGPAGGLPEVALFEADGGFWASTATSRVRDWLTAELPATVAVLA